MIQENLLPRDTMTSAVQVIGPEGILDAVSGEGLRGKVAEAINAGSSSIVIDLQSVSFMDSSGFGALVMALKKAKEAGCRLMLQRLNPQVRLVLELTGTDGIFEIVAADPEPAG